MASGALIKCGRCAFRNDSGPLSLANCLVEQARDEAVNPLLPNPHRRGAHHAAPTHSIVQTYLAECPASRSAWVLTGHSLLFLGEGRRSHQARRHPFRRWRVLDGRKLCVAWETVLPALCRPG